jgi:hypothetical protein
MRIEPVQITDNYDEAYLNMMDSGAGGVGVWAMLFLRPTYLLRRGNCIFFITFQSAAWADEWFEQNEGYEVLWSFEPGEDE